MPERLFFDEEPGAQDRAHIALFADQADARRFAAEAAEHPGWDVVISRAEPGDEDFQVLVYGPWEDDVQAGVVLGTLAVRHHGEYDGSEPRWLVDFDPQRRETP